MDWRRCAVCSHAAQHSIEKKIREGASLELLAEYYGVSDEVLRRHRDSHMNSQLPARAVRSAVVTTSRMDAEAMFAEHEDCIRECRELIDFARAKQNVSGWARGIAEWRSCLHQQAMMLGIYNQVDPRLGQARSRRIIEVVSQALEKFPEARGEVLAAIELVEEDEVGG
jgi:hypothetical protein